MITVNNREIEFHQGMTVAEALKEAGEILDAMTIVFMDNKVLQHDKLGEEMLEGFENIKLLKIVSGG
jgi:thiamine biosynthesis protein ThiS